MYSKAKNLLGVEQKGMELSQTGILEVNLQNNEESLSIDSDDQIEKIVKALSSQTRRKILQYIQEDPMDVSDIASSLNMTEANISAQIKKLEDANLITCDYSSGAHGVRKLSKLRFTRLLIKF